MGLMGASRANTNPHHLIAPALELIGNLVDADGVPLSP
jgi:hypothetical protein